MKVVTLYKSFIFSTLTMTLDDISPWSPSIQAIYLFSQKKKKSLKTSEMFYLAKDQ